MNAQKIIAGLLTLLLVAVFGLWAFQASYTGVAMLAAGLSCGLFLFCLLRYIPAFAVGMVAADSDPNAGLGLRSLRPSRRHPWLKIALGVLCLRLFFYILAYGVDMAVNGYSGGILNGLSRLWLRTDSPSYLGIAENWYVTEGDPRFHIVFFPLYPLLIRAFSYVTGGNYFAAAMVVSNLCAMGSGILLYELAALDFNRRDSLYITALMLVFPGAIFLGAPMTESLFLLLSLGAVYCGRKGRFFPAALLTALAGFTRSVGILLALVLAVEMLLRLLRGDEKPRPILFLKYGACLLTACLGTAAYLLVNYLVTGDAFTFLTYQREHWSQSLGLFFNTAAYQTEYLLQSLLERDMTMVLGLYLPNLLCGFGALALMVPAIGRLRLSYGAYFLAYFLVAMGCTWLLSAPRYLAVCFPLALGLGALLRDARPLLRLGVLLALFLSACAYCCLYILGYPVY